MVYHGLFVRASAVPDLNANTSEGLLFVPSTNAMIYVPATATLLTVATAGKEKVAILQIDSSGVISAKYSAEVTAGSGLAVYPAPDSGKFLLAYLFTASAPILNATTAVANSNINNLVLSAEFGGR